MRPWWWRPDSADLDAERTVGEPGAGRVLVATMRDGEGNPVEWAWVDESVAWQWDDTRWSSNPRG